MRLKTRVEHALRRFPPLFRLASRLYHGVRGGLRPLSPAAVPALRDAFQLARRERPQDPMHYYEFGLFRGYTFLMAQRISKELGIDGVRMWGFDSFSGLPPVSGEDKGDGQFFEGQFACSREEVERHLTTQGFDWSRAVLIEGYYNESLTPELRTRHPFERAGVVLFDCDLYTSTKDAIEWMAPYLDHGTVALFDDWYSYGRSETEGQPKAFREFLQSDRRFEAEPLMEFGNHGKGFLLRKR